MTTNDALIVQVLRSYFPDWEPPVDRGREWVSALCPFHGDERPSASVSYTNNAFACFACGEKGNAVGIIMRKEGIGYNAALEHAEKLSPGSNAAVRNESAGKQRRRVFGDSARSEPSGDKALPPGIRERPTPWS